ncbi:MAG: hypothetical protein R3B89_24285 [Polyangiaceae bacterium]
MSDRMVEMVWTCSSCRRENLGRHLVCQTCGSPKEEHEEYRMPGAPETLATVTDPRLLQIAHGGANWRCRYCGSNQRAADGDCANCGGDRTRAQQVRPAIAVPAAKRKNWLKLALTACMLVALGLAPIWLIFRVDDCGPDIARPKYNAFQQQSHVEYATVVSAEWTHSVDVERWQIVDREGFADAKPKDALDVRALGERQHHVDKVPDGFDTETYTVEEPNGFRTETYTDREQCGQDCTTLPQTCRQVCTPQGNGFAKCSQKCSGGGRSCSPKYCTVTKTRQVPQTHMVTKTRQVPKFKDVPVMKAYYKWRQWDWKLVRTIEEKGGGFDTRWPSDERIQLGDGLKQGEKERKSQSATYSVYYRTATGKAYTYRPKQLAEFTRCRDTYLTLKVWQSRDPEALGIPIAGQAPAPSVDPR